MVMQDALLIAIALVLCESKLGHIRIRNVSCLFTFRFYRRHMETAWRKFTFVRSK
jgi:hypothetical protein